MTLPNPHGAALNIQVREPQAHDLAPLGARRPSFGRMRIDATLRVTMFRRSPRVGGLAMAGWAGSPEGAVVCGLERRDLDERFRSDADGGGLAHEPDSRTFEVR